ncbi:FAD-binding oxidoreductase [Streptomyces canus]|uniref:FAD-binding oxidoreductase n=1 Tax=Streptomyces canus TaxID=58343 RepID=UPI00074AF8E7|nr:FAD-binding oxidoreductase [Streptomyces canus]KUN04314.1 FAD-linked oxidase [Streptomyces canus]
MSAAVRPSFDDFPTTFRGQCFRPGDSGYPEARAIFNMRMNGWTPGLIARAADSDDVVTAVRYAAKAGIPLAVKSGGHSIDALAMPDGALVVDMTNFKEIEVDAATGRARLGAGVLLGEMDAALIEHGLVVPAGTVSTTGVAGLTLGGGVGYNMRRFGATVDNLLACDVVTADGRKVRASAEENPDLFWALRGGGGNFGVVTHFEYQAHPFPGTVSAGFIPFTLDQAPKILAGLRSYIATAPRELSVISALTPCPPFPFVSQDMHLTNALLLVVVYTGEPENADSVIGDLAALGKPMAVGVEPVPWTVANGLLDIIAPAGRRVESTGGYLAEMTDEVIEIAVNQAAAAPPPTNPMIPSATQNFWVLSGALKDTDESATAFSRENAGWFYEVNVNWDDESDDETYLSWAHEVFAELEPYFLPNVYMNLTHDLGAEWRKGIWGGPEKYGKLVAAKTKWDPTNMFRHNKNIEPGN